MSTIDNEIESLSDELVVNCAVTHDTEDDPGKVGASCDDERDDTAIHTNNDGNRSRENDVAMNEGDDHPDDKSDASDKQDDADQRGHTSENNEKEASIENGKTNLTHLPIDVLRLVIGFAGIRHTFGSWGLRPHMSLTVTNRYFYSMRRHLYLRLNKRYSLKYYEDQQFRSYVHSRLENPSTQLSLDLSKCYKITDVSALSGVHALNLRECYKITDVSALSGVHTLDLRECSNITDVSALGGVHTLNLSYCHYITDVSALGGVRTLTLSECRNITDVSALGGVHTLDLRFCRNITDVSALGGVHTLDLRGCRNITDVSALGGVHTLYLSDCRNITDVSALGGVHTLYLRGCDNITDVSALGGGPYSYFE